MTDPEETRTPTDRAQEISHRLTGCEARRMADEPHESGCTRFAVALDDFRAAPPSEPELHQIGDRGRGLQYLKNAVDQARSLPSMPTSYYHRHRNDKLPTIRALNAAHDQIRAACVRIDIYVAALELIAENGHDTYSRFAALLALGVEEE